MGNGHGGHGGRCVRPDKSGGHRVGDERAIRERRSRPITAPGHARAVVRRTVAKGNERMQLCNVGNNVPPAVHKLLANSLAEPAISLSRP